MAGCWLEISICVGISGVFLFIWFYLIDKYPSYFREKSGRFKEIIETHPILKMFNYLKGGKKKQMKETILETEIPREKGYLYYTSTNEKGNITICKTEMARGGKKKEKKSD